MIASDTVFLGQITRKHAPSPDADSTVISPLLDVACFFASASPMRWKEVPEVPTLREQGYYVEIDSWIGLAYPKGVPPALRDRLERVAMAAAEGPQVARIFESAGVDPAPLTGAEYRRKLVQGHESMGAAIKAANLPRMN